MLRYILNNLAGYLRIRVEGYSPERFLNLCCYHGIFLWNLRPAKGAYEMNIRVRDFRRLRPMVRKSRAKVRIIQKRGVPFLYINTVDGSFFYRIGHRNLSDLSAFFFYMEDSD